MTQPPHEEAEFEISDIYPRQQGGQQVGVHPSHIKVLHKPTGIYAVCMAERSQHKNRTVAMAMVQYGLAELKWNNILEEKHD